MSKSRSSKLTEILSKKCAISFMRGYGSWMARIGQSSIKIDSILPRPGWSSLRKTAIIDQNDKFSSIWYRISINEYDPNKGTLEEKLFAISEDIVHTSPLVDDVVDHVLILKMME